MCVCERVFFVEYQNTLRVNITEEDYGWWWRSAKVDLQTGHYPVVSATFHHDENSTKV